jgi:hypothetical protein
MKFRNIFVPKSIIMLRSLLAIGIFLYLAQKLSSQSYFNSASVLNVEQNKSKSILKLKNVKATQLNEISLALKIDARKLLKDNGVLKQESFKEGTLSVDITSLALLKEKNINSLKDKKIAYYIPVYYSVRKGESLYGISKWSNESIPSLQKRNSTLKDGLSPGEKVLLGWIATPKLTITTQKDVAKTQIKSESIEKKKTDNKLTVDVNKSTKVLPTIVISKDTTTEVALLAKLKKQNEKLNTSRGIAYWAPSHRMSTKKYALHDAAPINSTIMLYNPMLKKSTTAKVIGRIPRENYSDEVSVVLSPAAAQSLGARDSRFMIDMKYNKL